MAGSFAHSWHPEVPNLREVYHAQFEHAYPMHTHDAWSVVSVVDGVVDYGLDHAEHHAVPGALTLLPPDVPHDGRSASPGRSYRKRVLYLEADWLPATAQGPAASMPTLDDAEVVGTVRRVHDALSQPGDLLAAEQGLIDLRGHILARLGAPDAARRDTPLARRLRELLDDRFTESFTIADVAGELGTHPSHLTRSFSTDYGVAPHQYVIGRRVDLARRLLTEGVRPADAAQRAGFHDQSHMTRHVRRVLGATPSTFRS